MEEKEIDINNENEILEKFDFNYCYNSEKCSRELCMFFNDVCMTKRENFDKRQALIDLGIIAITLNQQDKRIKELEKENQQLKQLQKQLAIEELERVKEINFNHFVFYGLIPKQALSKWIDNQIKKIKGEK